MINLKKLHFQDNCKILQNNKLQIFHYPGKQLPIILKKSHLPNVCNLFF